MPLREMFTCKTMFVSILHLPPKICNIYYLTSSSLVEEPDLMKVGTANRN